MKCPTDSATLVMSERSGVEIDYCPQCRGVWLDRGELDKIIERAEAEFRASTPAPPQNQEQNRRAPQYGERDNDRDRDRNRGFGDRSGDYDNRDGYNGKRKESWLSNLFD